jgi:riboflavin kinase / FMN adenylyltransferase
MQILTWTQIERIFSGDEQRPPFLEKGSAATVGSFDGPHTGHDVLFNAVLGASDLYGYVPGIVTFSQSLGGFKRPESYEGDLSTLEQRLEVLDKKGMSFAVVIDFSIEFGKIEGQDFLSILMKSCGLRFLAEGRDFRCGYGGSFGMKEISEFSVRNGITVQFPEPVMYKKERISSSLIRSCIFRGDFYSAEEMLGRKYTLDCSQAVWKQRGNSLSAERQCFLQALPCDGIYDVVVITPDNRIRLRLNVEPHFLRLEVPARNTLSHIRNVEFISQIH